MKSRLTNRSWVSGFLGFLGLAGINGYPAMLLFFAFFGGFQYFWWNKIGLAEDERLIRNRTHAASKAFRFTVIFGFVLSLLTSFLSMDFEILYKVQLCIFALSFALGTNLWAYLTYKYDMGE